MPERKTDAAVLLCTRGIGKVHGRENETFVGGCRIEDLFALTQWTRARSIVQEACNWWLDWAVRPGVLSNEISQLQCAAFSVLNY